MVQILWVKNYYKLAEKLVSFLKLLNSAKVLSTSVSLTVVSLVFPVNAKLGTALEVLQLCLKLLRPTCRDELRRLLTFMALASDPQEMKLDKEVSSILENKMLKYPK